MGTKPSLAVRIFFTNTTKVSGVLLVLASILFSFIAPAVSVAATSPNTIGYQGYIQQSGTPVTGSENFTFALYSATSGGSALWTETQSNVPVTSGYFSVSLGTQTPFPSNLDFSQSYYLQVTVNGTTLAPRQSLDAVPFAHVAYGVIPTSTAPSAPNNGSTYFDPTGSGTFYVYDANSGWTALATTTNSGASTTPTIVNLATSVTGSLPAANGGTGLSGSVGLGLLVGDGNGGWTQVATSSLGLTTTNVAEGSNLYFTNARADNRFANDLAATTTDALAEGTTNLYFTNARADARIALATSLPSLQTLPGLTLTGTINANGNSITGVPTPVNATDAANKSYVDTFVQGLTWQAPVIALGSTTPPVSPNTGDRYVVGNSATGAWIGEDRTIATWTGSAWSFLTPSRGYTIFVSNTSTQYNYNGTSWVPIGSGTNFSSLTGIAATSQGGTGIASGPLYGQLLLGNSSGGYSLVATSSLGFVTPSGVASILAGTTTDALPQGVTNLYYSNALARNAISSNALGLTYASTTGQLALTSGYTIPTVASTTAWNNGISPWTVNTGNIQYNGGVGIGTTNPTAGSLALSGGITANGNILTSPAGSSTSSPRVFGFSPTYGTGQAAQFQFGSTGNVIQNAYYDRMQIESYWGLEIRGNQESLSPQFVSGYATDAALSLYGSTGNSTNIMNINNNGGTTLDVITSNGNLAIGTTTASATLTVGGNALINGALALTGALTDTSTATSTLAGGTNITSGCYAVNGVCITSGTGSGAGLTTSGVASIIAATTTDALAQGTTNLYYSNALARAAISTSEPALTYSSTSGQLALTSGYTIPTTASTTAWSNGISQWTTSGSTISYAGGSVGIGTTTPGATLAVNGNALIAGALAATGGLSVNGAINDTSTATSTLAGGTNITSGCYAVNGVCLTSGAGALTANAVASILAATTTDAIAQGTTNLYYSNALARNAISSNALGLTYASTTGQLALTSGYTIPTVASTTAWNNGISPWTINNGNISYSGGVGIGTTTTSAGSLALSGGITTGGNIITSPAGSSTASPRVFGFSPTYGVGQAAQFEFGSTGNVIQNSYQGRMQIYSYWGLEIHGNQQSTSPQFVSGNSSDAALSLFGTTGNSGNILNLNTNGGTTLDVITSNGSMGIGTTSPATIFGIDSTATTGTIMRISNGSAGGHVYSIAATGSGNTSGTGELDFYDATAGASRLNINANGNVGIGTTSPSYGLVVSNSGVNSGFGLAQEEIAGSGSEAGLYLLNTSTGGRGYNLISTGSTSGLGQGNFSIVDSTAGAARLTINSIGNIGIGATPSVTAGNRLVINGGSNNSHLQFLSGNASDFAEFDIGRASNDASIDVADGAGNFSSDAVAGDLVLRDDTNGHILFNTNSGGGASTLDISSNHVSVDTASNDGSYLEVYASNDTADTMHVRNGNTYIYEGAASSNPYAVIGAYNSSTNGAVPLELQSQGGFVGIGTNGTYNNDKLSINATSGYTNGLGIAIPQNNTAIQIFNNSAAGSYNALIFYRDGGTSNIVGSITSSQSATAYNTGSDARIKQNIATTTDSLAQLMGVQVADFEFKSDPSQQVTGFIAQNLENIFPDAVTTNGDNGLVPLGASSTPWQVDYGRVTPLIVKAVQDIANISSTFETNLVAWLGSTANGIHDIYTNTSHQKTLCVGSAADGGETCITKAQLDQLLQREDLLPASSSSTSAPNTSDTAGSAPSSSASSTDTSSSSTAPSLSDSSTSTTTPYDSSGADTSSPSSAASNNYDPSSSSDSTTNSSTDTSSPTSAPETSAGSTIDTSSDSAASTDSSPTAPSVTGTSPTPSSVSSDASGT